MTDPHPNSEASISTADQQVGRQRSVRKILATVTIVVPLVILGSYAGLKIWLNAAVPAGAPVIGVTFDTVWHARARISTKNYEIAMTRAGGQILEIEFDQQDAEAVLDQIDALLLTGGGDIDPRLYGGDTETAQLVDRKRDDFEIALIRGAIRRDMPILGICRGIQILNVAQGGTLRNLRHKPRLSATHGIGLESMSAHSVEITSDSKLAQILGAGVLSVNSFHGQAVDRVGDDLVVAARAPDGIVEAVEMPSRSYIVCTQWHPEVPTPQTGVFDEFLKEARAYRERQKPSERR